MEKNEGTEQTLVLIKPDALKNSLTGYILSQLSEFSTGLQIAGTKTVCVSRMLAEEHYAEHKGKGFYASLLDYITGRLHYPDAPQKRMTIAIVYQGTDSVKKIRDLCGPTNPHVARDQKPGCIRALGTIVPIKDADGKIVDDRMDNLIHASATSGDAEKEIKLWFMPCDLPPSMRSYPTEVVEGHYYFRDNSLCITNEPGSICLLAPGDIAWKTDMDVLRAIREGKQAAGSLGSVAAKYLINRDKES